MNFKRIFTGSLCNNNCIFCFNTKKKDKHKEEIKTELKKLKINNLSLYGGEVTIRKDFFELIHYAKELKFKKIRIETNARIFASKEFCQKTIDAGVTEFLVSLHGFCKEQHEFITRTPESFKQTMKGISNLINLEQSVSANTVIVKPNYRNLPKIVSAFTKLKIKDINLNFVNPLGKAFENFESSVPRYSMAAPYLARTIDKCVQRNIKISLSSVPPCIMTGYENNINNTIPNEKAIRFRKCQDCQFKNKCSGFWKNYITKYGINELNKKNIEKIK